MNIYLPGYCFGNRMAVVARSDDLFHELQQRQADIMRITDSEVIFYPGEYSLEAKDIRADRLALLQDYDIVEISETGILYRAFANKEADTTLFLGASCNSNCIMCPAGDNERRAGFSYSRDLLTKYIEYLPADLEYLIITGGEPTMKTDLFLEALDRVKNKFPYTQVLLLTNGRSLSDRDFFCRVCETQPANFRVAIPIHGDTPQLHDYITRAEGSFEQTMLGLKRLMNSDIKVEVRVVVTKTNCDNLLDIARLISDNFPRVFIVNFLGLEPRGNCALNFDSVYIDHRTSFLKSKAAIDHLMRQGYDVGLYNYPLCAVDKDYWPLAAKSISDYKNVFHPDCESCSVKSICAGFFTAAMNIAHPTVTPFVAKEVIK